MAIKKGNEVSTIDVNLVTIKVTGATDEIGLVTANKIEVTPSTETTDAVKNIVKLNPRARILDDVFFISISSI